MIFRLSQKLNIKLKAGTLTMQPLDENPLADWSAHLMAFILCYIAAHLALDLVNEQEAEAILNYCESHLDKG